MSQLLYQAGLLTTLAYLMGERTVNATTSAPRGDFLQKTIEEVYQAYEWPFAKRSASLAITSGIATLPTNYDFEHALHARYGTETNDFIEIPQEDRGQAVDGSRKFWITSPAEGTFVFNTADTVTPLDITYQSPAPVLDAAGTTGTAYSSGSTLTLGARRYVKLGQNPDADISQDQKLFEKLLANDIAAVQVPAPRRKRKTPTYRTGDF